MSVAGRDGDDPPAGFAPLAIGGNFMAHNGPLYVRMVDGRAQLGDLFGCSESIKPGHQCIL